MPERRGWRPFPARSHQGPSPAMRELKDELDPPFEIIEPADWRGPVVFNSPHSGSIYPRAFLTASRLDTATLRRSEDSFVDELALGVVPARLSADAGAFPALLCRRQSRALRARSAHVRGPAAVVRQYPLDAGGRRARHGRAGGRRRPGNLRPAHSGRRRDPPDREPVQALSPGAAPAVHARPPRFRRGGADRLPFDAVDRGLQGRAAARRRRARRPLRHELRAAGRRDDRADLARAWATRSAATSPMPAASSPSITAIRPPGCMRSSSSSIARSTWTSGASSARRRFAGWRPIWKRWPSDWRAHPDRGIAALSGGGGVSRARCCQTGSKKRGRLREASGPSLGRKRPRRAAVTRGATAPQ